MARIDCWSRAGGRLVVWSLVILVLAAGMSAAADESPVRPGPKDKCPVCGMFVSKYPDWIASMRLKDGSSVFFDGPKDLFACYLDLGKYRPGKSLADIVSLRVMDYYDVQTIDARTAWYVMGSDVYGPMGKELIPFGSRGAAEEFLKDHQGTTVLRFDDVSRKTLSALQ